MTVINLPDDLRDIIGAMWKRIEILESANTQALRLLGDTAWTGNVDFGGGTNQASIPGSAVSFTVDRPRAVRVEMFAAVSVTGAAYAYLRPRLVGYSAAISALFDGYSTNAYTNASSFLTAPVLPAGTYTADATIDVDSGGIAHVYQGVTAVFLMGG